MSADAVKVLFWGTILLVMAVWGIRKLRTLNRQAEAKPQWQPEWWRAFPEQPVLLSDEPDIPEPLGTEITWLAVRCEDPERVMEFLDVSGQRANWATGLAAARQGDGLFVSPPMDGFVLVVFRDTLPGAEARHLPPSEDWYEDAEWEHWAAVFDEVQRFDVSDRKAYYCWERALSSRLIRRQIRYGYWVYMDVGPMTEGELLAARAGIARRGTGAPFTAEDVQDIAAAWGVDPRFEKDYLPSVGWLCRLSGWKED